MLSKRLLIITEPYFRQGNPEILPFLVSRATFMGVGSDGTPFHVDLETFHCKRTDKTNQQVQKHHRYPDFKG
jgi:hypothetical protein